MLSRRVLSRLDDVCCNTSKQCLMQGADALFVATNNFKVDARKFLLQISTPAAHNDFTDQAKSSLKGIQYRHNALV